MSKISELSDGGSLQSTDYLIAVRSGGNVKVRPNGAVSGTTGQFSTSLNVDGTVTADGLTVDASSAELQKSTGSTFIIGTKDTPGTTASPIYTDIKFEGWNNSTNALLRSWDESTSTGYGRLEIQTNDSSSAKRRALFDYNGDISFYEDTGTTPKFFWDASAEALGIGTSSLTSNASLSIAQGGVHVDGGASGGASQVILSTGASSGSNFGQISNTGTRWSLGYGGTQQTVGTEVLTWNSSGNVGIGTTSPSSELHVKSSGTSSDTLTIENSTGNGSWRVKEGGSSNALLQGYNASNSETIRLDPTSDTFFNGGNVGIGTSSPQARLHVETSGDYQMRMGSSTSYYDIGRNITDGLLYFTGNQNGFNGYVFGGINGERMRIDSSGNVGINTTDIGANLSVRGNASTGVINVLDVGNAQNAATTGDGARIRLHCTSDENRGVAIGSYSETNYATDNSMVFYTSASSTLSEKMRIDSSGNLLVGKTSNTFSTSGFVANANGMSATRSAGACVQINRTTSDGAIAEFYKDGSIVGSISVTASATAYNTSSDARLKENIADAESASGLIDALQVRQFDWKADGSHQRYGMVAQELLEVAPEAVSQPEDPDDMMGVDYSKLVPMLVKEIQSLRARVAQLEGA